MKFLFLLGRMIVGGYFVYNGLNHVVYSTDMLSGYARSKGVPQPRAAVYGSGAMMLAGGVSLLLGLKPKIGAALLLTFLGVTSPTMHNFWAESESQRMADEVNFLKNMALIGAVLTFMSLPEPWPLSLSGVEPEETSGTLRNVAA